MVATATASKTLVDQFQNIRRVSTPLAEIRTVDPASVAARITEANNDQPVVQWDASAGFNARTKAGNAALAQIMGKETGPILNAADAMFMARNAPANTILFMFNAHRVWQDLTTAQGMWNLRDGFKANYRTLVLLTTPEAVLPRELEGDVIVLDDPLPDVAQIERIITTQCKHAHPPLPVPDNDTMRKATDAMKGLAPFIVEQSVALALRKNGISVPDLWLHKKQSVQKTPGATIYEGKERFSDIGGHDGLKMHLNNVIRGKRPVKVVVIFDEFEKMIAGASSDHVGDGGVAKDKAQQILTFMQNKRVRGAILFGHPGAGKTAVAKAMGNEADCLVIMADMGAMSGGIVGESEARVRAFFNMVDAIAGEGGAFFVATCNSTGAITTEMRRRFKSGFFFVDLPDATEKKAIWKIQMAAYGIADQKLPNDYEWTGSDIANCCEKADDYGISLIDAAKGIVPVAQQQPELVQNRRAEANGSMLSAATGEVYRMPEKEVPAVAGGAKQRRVMVES